MSKLRKGVLVLNSYLIPIFITDLKHAFSLLFREAAKVVGDDLILYNIWEWIKLPASDGDESIGLVRGRMRIPRVVAIKHPIRPKIKMRISKYAILIRDNLTCQYCGRWFEPWELTVDHILPKSRGGEVSWENLIACCVECNKRKGDRTPEEANMKLIRPPRRPTFAVVADIPISDLRLEDWYRFLPK